PASGRSTANGKMAQRWATAAAHPRAGWLRRRLAEIAAAENDAGGVGTNTAADATDREHHVGFVQLADGLFGQDELFHLGLLLHGRFLGSGGVLIGPLPIYEPKRTI